MNDLAIILCVFAYIILGIPIGVLMMGEIQRTNIFPLTVLRLIGLFFGLSGIFFYLFGSIIINILIKLDSIVIYDRKNK
jgi:hypothetical protein